jgi:hypothetical protein
MTRTKKVLTGIDLFKKDYKKDIQEWVDRMKAEGKTYVCIGVGNVIRWEVLDSRGRLPDRAGDRRYDINGKDTIDKILEALYEANQTTYTQPYRRDEIWPAFLGRR